MTEKLLDNKIIFISKAKDAGSNTISELEVNGAEVIYLPTISILPRLLSESETGLLKNLAQYDYLIFTSSNACEIFFRHVNLSNIISSKIIVAAVGNSTSKTCLDYGIRVNIIPPKSSALGLIEELRKVDLSSKKVLLPVSALSGDELPEALIEMGANIDVIQIYDTTCGCGAANQYLIEKVKQAVPDIFVFTSPSSFTCFLRIFSIIEPEVFFYGKVICALGPSTEKSITDQNLIVNIVPETTTLSGVEEAIIKYFYSIQNIA
jgi:uroporphyrinogen-III synthase